MIHLHCHEGVSWCAVRVFEKRYDPCEKGWHGPYAIKPLKRYVHVTVEGLNVATCLQCVAAYAAARLRYVTSQEEQP